MPRAIQSLGERLRREGRRVESREHLRGALERFARLEAEPWIAWTERELRASGEKVRRRDTSERDRLTPQELQVAMTVARGATNREAGAQLFLSPKTVKYHLSLGLRSRTELASRLAAAGTVDPSGDAPGAGGAPLAAPDAAERL
jgi:DNA-binding NarL/FixJ family response regulator